MLLSMRHTDSLQHVLHPPFSFSTGHISVAKRKLDILVHRQITDQIERLKDKADLAVTYARAVGQR